jgi:excisionase family DNA binding protein
METEQMLTTEEVAHWLQVPVRTIQRWAREGSIPYLRVGRQLRFERAEVRQWMKKAAQAGPPTD